MSLHLNSGRTYRNREFITNDEPGEEIKDNISVIKFLEVLNNAMINDFTSGCEKHSL